MSVVGDKPKPEGLTFAGKTLRVRKAFAWWPVKMPPPAESLPTQKVWLGKYWVIEWRPGALHSFAALCFRWEAMWRGVGRPTVDLMSFLYKELDDEAPGLVWLDEGHWTFSEWLAIKNLPGNLVIKQDKIVVMGGDPAPDEDRWDLI
jgi:hypothetical protein